ncbi:LuxR C-terminal-related transcriptional regulator [Dyadobacter chenwenxiniae]|uniref:LuxR C-terminal-related transcriptional regulator n=1 Tax=Dyadobacter chenwenxiniae TaxID=2906456 RepID=A0A9X1PH41_9BACT|nr:LuxR family transcriptional regulator [Dyadobacter chenwenxiniae]MCF0060638.1 LuxR C-terminal-related transcriptional regulator [Dyadobacter chenwenxiniae]UON80470.1 LuxR C-terminal-related transcriptional regulator [Dyadobacter chenwenxiniae]
MNSTQPIAFDLTTIRKIWKSDILKSEAKEIEEYLRENPLLTETLNLNNTSVAIIDIQSMRYLCCLGDAEPVIGWSNDMIMREGVQFFLSKVFPPDYVGFETMSAMTTEYVCKLDDHKIISFKSLFDFRMVRPDGSLTRVMHQGVALKRDPFGNISFLLALISDITHLKRDGRQHLHLTNGSENLIYEVNNETGISKKLESLSDREREIARLVGKKLTSEDIAKKLFISTHTVNTHRQNMLKKLDMADTMELINFLTVYHLI